MTYNPNPNPYNQSVMTCYMAAIQQLFNQHFTQLSTVKLPPRSPLHKFLFNTTAMLLFQVGASQLDLIPRAEYHSMSGWDHETQAGCCQPPQYWSLWTTAACASCWCDCKEWKSLQWNTAAVLRPASSVRECHIHNMSPKQCETRPQCSAQRHRPYKCYRLAATASRAWGSTRIGTRSDPFPAVRRRSPAADKTPPAGSSCVRRRHTDLRFLSTMWRRRPLRKNVCLCRRGAVVDEGQPSAGTSVKNRGPVLLVGPSSAPDTNHIGTDRHRWCVAGLLGPRPRRLHRLGRRHAVARDCHRAIVLRSASTAT